MRGQSSQLPPPVGSPRFARATARGAPTRFSLRAGGTLRRGASIALVFVNCVPAIGMTTYGLSLHHSADPLQTRFDYGFGDGVGEADIARRAEAFARYGGDASGREQKLRHIRRAA